jgi:hypothetical protein
LDVVTQRENVLRGTSPQAINARTTACPKGHPLAGANLSVRQGKRYCKECNRQRSQRVRAYAARQRVALAFAQAEGRS